MSRLPLHTLPAFRTVARLNNLRAAADELHLTHSAVSQQIRLLEDQLGFELFDRRGRRIVLNAAGAALLRTVEPALEQLDEGVRAAAAAAKGTEHRLRVTVLPSFAQRWLLPRMGSWREKHPGIAVELHTSQQLVDLKRDGFHAALRQGKGPWRGLDSQCLIDSRAVVLGSPRVGRRLLGLDAKAAASLLIDEPLLGNAARWESWFAQAGVRCRVNPVAAFNDAGLMLQAVEQDLGIAMCRELLAADALRDGRLVRLSPVPLPEDEYDAFWLAHPPELADWPPLVALRDWLVCEMAQSEQELSNHKPLSPPPAPPPLPPPAIKARRRAATAVKP